MVVAREVSRGLTALLESVISLPMLDRFPMIVDGLVAVAEVSGQPVCSASAEGMGAV
jgi:hypothetical protein